MAAMHPNRKYKQMHPTLAEWKQRFKALGMDVAYRNYDYFYKEGDHFYWPEGPNIDTSQTLEAKFTKRHNKKPAFAIQVNLTGRDRESWNFRLLFPFPKAPGGAFDEFPGWEMDIRRVAVTRQWAESLTKRKLNKLADTIKSQRSVIVAFNKHFEELHSLATVLRQQRGQLLRDTNKLIKSIS